MKLIVLILLFVTLSACSPSDSPKQENSPTVEELAADPTRLKELRLKCETDRAKLGDELCNRVAEATNRRFLGDGKTPYSPPKESPKF